MDLTCGTCGTRCLLVGVAASSVRDDIPVCPGCGHVMQLGGSGPDPLPRAS